VKGLWGGYPALNLALTTTRDACARFGGDVQQELVAVAERAFENTLDEKPDVEFRVSQTETGYAVSVVADRWKGRAQVIRFLRAFKTMGVEPRVVSDRDGQMALL